MADFKPFVTEVTLIRRLSPSADAQQLLDVGAARGTVCMLLEIDAVDNSNPPAPVPLFVYQLAMNDPRAQSPDQQYIAMYSNVASANDMQELPIGIPTLLTDPTTQMFLLDKISVICQSLDAANFIWSRVQAHVDQLVAQNRQFANTPLADTYTTTYVAGS